MGRFFERMPGLPQEHADVSNVFIVAWTGKLCALDSALSSKRRVTNRCGIVPLELSVGTDRDQLPAVHLASSSGSARSASSLHLHLQVMGTVRNGSNGSNM